MKIPVVMISKKLPNDPPQAPIQDFYLGSALHGNIKLAPPKQVVNAKPTKDNTRMNGYTLGLLHCKSASSLFWGVAMSKPRSLFPGQRIPILRDGDYYARSYYYKY
jgi:hypothetical protein